MPDIARLRAWRRAMSARISQRGDTMIGQLTRLGADENTVLLVFALVIGTAVGVAVIIFYKLIDLAQAASLTAVGRLTGIGSVSILLVVIAGLTLTRLLIRYGTGDSEGENVPDVMGSVARRGGTMRAFPVAIKTAGAALVIGTGGSVGAEGPVVVAGSALGSKIGRFFRSGPERLKLLVACGAAAGISAAFNAPIAGVFFSLEKVIGSFGASAFPPVLVASVIAAVVSRAAFGDTPVIEIPTQYVVGSASELIFYALLGVATGIVAAIYTRGVYRTADALQRLPSGWQRIALAAIIVGTLDIMFRDALWGRGQESLSFDIISQHGALCLIALAAAKLVATSVTLAAARCGGVFTPALFIGATLGGGLGMVAARALPQFTIVPEAFALVGMAGLVAGATHAPLTAIMIVFEMTSDYALILPLMLCGAIAYITARRIHPESIYSEWLVRRGINLHAGRDTAVMERLHVRDSYDSDPHVIGEGATVPQIVKAIGASSQIEFPVLDADLKLVGMLSHDDLRTVLTDTDRYAPVILAGDLASQVFERVTLNDTLGTALQKLAVRGAHYVPVVADDDPYRLLGVIGRKEVLTAYDRAVLGEQ